MFNVCLKKGYFSSVWKSSFILPLYKNDSRKLIENYKRIAKHSALAKLFEWLVAKRLALVAESIISLCQHGFLEERSTDTNLLGVL